MKTVSSHYGVVSGYQAGEDVEALLALCRVLGLTYKIEPSTVNKEMFTVELKAILPRGYFWNAQREDRGICVVGASDVRGALISAINHVFIDLKVNLDGAVSSMDRAWRSWEMVYGDGSHLSLCAGEMR